MTIGSIFYIIYCIIAYIEYVPRIVKLIRTKSSNDYSLGSIALSMIGMFCWTAYVCITDQEFILYIGAIIDVTLNTLFACLVLKYRKWGKEKD
jgi:uncharacterized protein with PQ loop repeat